MAEKIRIKDIAERAGVSVGTVDRVLHDRPNVSKPARDKVEKALKEMNYQPNVYASALAYNKSYTFYLLIPKHESEAYWEEIEEGAKKCEDIRRDFHIDVEIRFYAIFARDLYASTLAQRSQRPSSPTVSEYFQQRAHLWPVAWSILMARFS